MVRLTSTCGDPIPGSGDEKRRFHGKRRVHEERRFRPRKYRGGPVLTTDFEEGAGVRPAATKAVPRMDQTVRNGRNGTVFWSRMPEFWSKLRRPLSFGDHDEDVSFFMTDGDGVHAFHWFLMTTTMFMR